ncbi:MAG TPA: chemotaxis-specific protein-glutamate methyltransferase CheB [Kofleriaceae bacterium]
MTRVRVLVVDDSLTVRKRIAEILAAASELEVVGEAGDGRTAIDMVRVLRPDVITLDLAMPDLDGLSATEVIMAQTPTPILIVSASRNRGELFRTYDALKAGAVDVLDKDEADPAWEERLIASVRMVARIKVITHPRHRLGQLARARSSELPRIPPSSLIAIGASTGGPGALVHVLSALPADFAVPVVVVLHIDDSYATQLAGWFALQLGRGVRLATPGPLAPGIVIAPPGRHLIVQHGALGFSSGPPRHHCQPSIDVLFESVALDYGARAVACLLTGMGRDGAQGLLAIRRAGGLTIAQDEATSVVYGMPREAVACGAAIHVLPLGEIGPTIRSSGGPR